jgi:hypothetical protein
LTNMSEDPPSQPRDYMDVVPQSSGLTAAHSLEKASLSRESAVFCILL